MQPEAQPSLPSMEATQADLRLYSALKTSVSSSTVYVDHSHNSKLCRKGGAKSPDTFKILFSIQFIVCIYTYTGVRVLTSTLKMQPELVNSVPVSPRILLFRLLANFISVRLFTAVLGANFMLLPRRINTFKLIAIRFGIGPVAEKMVFPAWKGS